MARAYTELLSVLIDIVTKPLRKIYMKCQDLFSLKYIYKKKIECYLLSA